MAGGARPVIEAVIRARDEASAVFANATKSIAGDAKNLESVLQSTGRGAKDAAASLSTIGTGAKGAADILTTVAGAASKVPGPIGGVAKAVTIAAAAWDALTPFIAPAIRGMQDASKHAAEMSVAMQGFSAAPFVSELKKMNAEMDAWNARAQSFAGAAANLALSKVGLGPDTSRRDFLAGQAALRENIDAEQRLRGTAAQRIAVQERQADTERRAALERGDIEGARAALARANQLADQKLAIEKQRITAEQAIRSQADFQQGVKTPTAVVESFQQRRDLADEQAAQARDERNARGAEQEQRREEQLAEMRSRFRVEAIQGERELEQARVEASTKVRAAELERAGDIQGALSTRLAGIAQVRDAELRAIREVADARAAAAKTPEEAAAVRGAEQRQVARANLTAAADVAGAQQRAADARERQQREREQAQRELDRMERADTREAATRTLPKLAAEVEQRGKRPMSYAQTVAQIEMERNLFYAKQAADEQMRADQDAEAEERRKRMDELRARASGGARGQIAAETTPGTPLKVERDAAGNARIVQDFAKAAENATKLTDAVKGLGEALKSLETSPGFAQKLSQDLADTLQFLGARNP